MLTSLEVSWSEPAYAASQVGPFSWRIGQGLADPRWPHMRQFCSLPCGLRSCCKLAWAPPRVDSRFLREQVGEYKGSWDQHLELAHAHFCHIPLAKASQRPLHLEGVEKPAPRLVEKSCKETLERDTGKCGGLGSTTEARTNNAVIDTFVSYSLLH